MEDTRTADVLLEPMTPSPTNVITSESSNIGKVDRTKLNSLCRRSKNIREKVKNHTSIESRIKRLDNKRRAKNLRLLPKIVQRPTFPTFDDSDEDADDEFALPPTPKRNTQYSSSCNVCFQNKTWCGFPHFQVKNTVPLSKFELRVRQRARIRMGKSFEWLDEKKDRNRLKQWNLRHVIYKPEAANTIQRYSRRFIIRIFINRIHSKFSRRGTYSHKIIRAAMLDARLRKVFFVTQMQKVVRGRIGRLLVKSKRVTSIQKLIRGHLGRVRIFRLRNSIARLNGSLQTLFTFQVCSGNDLASADSNGLSDPYCTVQVYGKEIGKTKKMERTLNPTWNSKFFPTKTFIPKSIPLNGIGGNWYLKDDPKNGMDIYEVLTKINKDELNATIEIRHEYMAKNIYLPISSLEKFPAEFATRANRLKPSKLLNKNKDKKKVEETKTKEKKKSSNLAVFDEIEFAEKLQLKLHRASNLKRADGIFGKSDPFVEVYYNGSCIARTKVIKKTLDPVWDETIEVFIPIKKNNDSSTDDDDFEIKFVIFDYDFAGSNDFLGQIVFDNRSKFEEILGTEEIITLPLTEMENKKDKKITGSLKFEVNRIEQLQTQTITDKEVKASTDGEGANQLNNDTKDESKQSTNMENIHNNELNSSSDDVQNAKMSEKVKNIGSGKWYYKDPRNFEHVHGPLSLSTFLYHIHSRTVYTEEICKLLVRHESVDFYLPLGQEDRFPQGWFSRAKKNVNGNVNIIKFEVKDKDMMSSTSLGIASISQSNLEILLHEAFVDDYVNNLKTKKRWMAKGDKKMTYKVLRLEDNDKIKKHTVEAKGTITVAYKVTYHMHTAKH